MAVLFAVFDSIRTSSPVSVLSLDPIISGFEARNCDQSRSWYGCPMKAGDNVTAAESHSRRERIKATENIFSAYAADSLNHSKLIESRLIRVACFATVGFHP